MKNGRFYVCSSFCTWKTPFRSPQNHFSRRVVKITIIIPFQEEREGIVIILHHLSKLKCISEVIRERRRRHSSYGWIWFLFDALFS